MGGDTFSLVWWVLFLPLGGFLVQAFLGKLVVSRMGIARGRSLMGTLAVLPVAAGFVIAVGLTHQLISSLQMGAPPSGFVVTLFQWIDIQGLRVPFEARIDALSMTMTLIVTGVGALIHIYATGYMAEDKDYTRFFTYMNLFIACMLTLVLANNLPMMFIGWEGVGLCSYLLIGFWYKDIANSKAANKAFIVNRIGDVGLTLGMFLILVTVVNNAHLIAPDDRGRWLSFDVFLPRMHFMLQGHPGLAAAIGILLFIGACGKSAQFPLYFWLPDAMAGPTPVSALIHAATMVTAGVFMVSRMAVIFASSPVASAVVACIGAFTAVFAALVAFGQADIKKVLAYSTVSQLGFMFIACGAGAYWAGIFHVATHAFFKALLFLGAGAVIHGMMHNQDMRNYGNLRKYMPITFVCMFIAYLAISGVPPFAGFFSKEAILGGALGNGLAVVNGEHLAVWAGWVGLFAAMLTAWYMTRLTALTFFGGEERWRALPEHGHDEYAEEHAAEHEEAHDSAHAHEDKHGFFYTDEELKALEVPEEEHHELAPNHTPHEAPPSMWVPLVILAVLCVVAGYVLKGPWNLQQWLYPGGVPGLSSKLLPGEPEHIPLTLLSCIAAGLGLIVGWVVYSRGLPKKEGWDMSKWSPFRRLAGAQFGYDGAVMKAGVDVGGQVGNAIWQRIDVRLIDGIVNGIAWLVSLVGRGLRAIQTGYVRGYALLMLIGGVGIIGYFVYLLATAGGKF
jgi:NADH-quinone oxidoreductase subunit L